MIVLYTFLIFLFCGTLVFSANIIIRNLSKIAIILKWSEFAISFILVGLTTSLPEIIIAITSAIHQIPTLSLGNIIGANIINLTLILGLVTIVGKNRLKLEKATTEKNLFYALILTFCPMLLALDKIISRIDGLAILFMFSLYILLMFYQEKRIDKIYDKAEKRDLFISIIYLVIGSVLLIISAEIVTKIAKALALAFNLPLIIIGLIIVSLGTTLPELIFGLRAAMKGHKEMSLGNSLGTIAVNSCLALGLVAVIYPIYIVNFYQFLILFGFLIIASSLFTFFIRSQKELSIVEGIILILFYVIFITIQVLLSKYANFSF